ncbi:signal protein [Streptosporangium sp. NPDC001559]|uniref:signal protein n=1 Tax=Streptosporangium sp. NPDC001559 TaxID=3366187 RepID=UPI0036E8702D
MPLRSVPFLLLLLGLVAGCGLRGTGAETSIQGRWWTWASSEPENTNPVTDPSGRFCHRNQPEDVWFLAGTFGGTARRTCEVPEGRPIVFPLVNRTATRAACRRFMAAAKGEAVLDGAPVTSERLTEANVAITGVAGNPLTGREGKRLSPACGIWVRLRPLKSGRHALTIRGSSGDFRTGVDYTLIVDPPGPQA